jgi:2-oxoisovalerate dehydrogenase E1 component alpha subunit
MLTISELDKLMDLSQRQGRVSFYMTNNGEEGIQIGSAAALEPGDNFFLQYRELGVFLWRGFTIEEIMNQVYILDLEL